MQGKIIDQNMSEIEKAIKRLKKVYDARSKAMLHWEDIRLGIHALQEKLDRRADGWISVEDGLPKKWGDYLVYVRGFQFPFTAEWQVGAQCFISKFITSDKVTHWMPLPQPPESEGKDGR